MTMNPILADRSIAEVIELHAFFQAWLRGDLPANQEVFQRFTAATAPDFIMIAPDGSVTDLHNTASWIYAAHGKRPGVLLWTDEHVVRHADEQTALVTYREWQTLANVTKGRISSALFRREPTAPLGVVWLHVHETHLD